MTPTPKSALAPAESQIAGLARRTQSFLDENWAIAWQQHLPEIERTYETKGEVAYGVYTRRLFAPLLAEMASHELHSFPRLPGSFRNSEERWGPPTNRERRFWSIITHRHHEAIGTLVTCFFHDHTRLRVPAAPTILALTDTEPVLVCQQACSFPSSIAVRTISRRTPAPR